MKIDVRELTTCGVDPNGELVELDFVDANGTPVSLRVRFDDAQAIAMTLPDLLTHALRRLTGKPEARYAFPLGAWCLEKGEHDCVIATLATEDGFKVAFSVTRAACDDLGWALRHEAESPMCSDEAPLASERPGRVRLN